MKKHFFSFFAFSFLTCVVLFTAPRASAQTWTTVGTAGFSNNSQGISHPHIAVHNGIPYVVYADGNPNGGTAKATVMKYNGSAWVPVGSPMFTPSGTWFTHIALDGSGTPYVVYQDASTTSSGLSVMKYNGSNWVNVGSPDITGAAANYTTIAIGKNDTPYIAFSDLGNSSKARVMKFNGTNWVDVGTAGFSAGATQEVFIVMDSTGSKPYVSFKDHATSIRATVMKFDGTSWNVVGTPGISTGIAASVTLALNSHGVPYITYLDDGLGSKASVMKFNGTSWVPVGPSGFTATMVRYTTIAFDSSDNPYISVADRNTGQASMMGFNGSNWIYVGNTPCTSDDAYQVFLTISQNIAYLCFTDDAAGHNATVLKLNSFSLSVAPDKALPQTISILYPNPATSVVTYSSSADFSEIVMINTLGQVVQEQKYQQPRQKADIDISRLPQGIYLVKIDGAEVRKLIKD